MKYTKRKMAITVLIAFSLLFTSCGTEDRRNEIQEKIESAISVSGFSCSELGETLVKSKIQKLRNDEVFVDFLVDKVKELYDSNNIKDANSLLESLEISSYKSEELLSKLKEKCFDEMEIFTKINIKETGLEGLEFYRACLVITQEEVNSKLENATLEEKINTKKALDNNSWEELNVPITQSEIDKYVNDFGTKVYSEPGTGEGYYATYQNKSRYRDIQSNGDIITESYEYFGDFAIHHYEREYLDTFYQIHTSIDNTLYFKQWKLYDMDYIGDIKYAPPYLFCTYENEIQVYHLKNDLNFAMPIRLELN